MQPAAGATRQPCEYVPDRAESDVDDPDLGAAVMEADAEGGGGGAGSGLRLSATFADCPEDDAEGEVAPRHQLRVGPSGAGPCTGLAGQGGATKREEAAAKANRFHREVRRLPLVCA